MKLIILFLFHASISAQENLTIATDRANCAANSAREWSSEVNRCVDKVQAVAIRNKAADCNKIENLDQRKSCHMNLATSDTGLSADANASASNITGGQTQSMVVNGAAAIVAAINYFAKAGKENTCMCKNIFGITAVGGIVTDIYLKGQTTKKLDNLQKQYQIDSKTTAFDAQYKALQYLRDEQKTIASIAAQEKKRQMLLTLGYGAAAATALYEGWFNEECYNPTTVAGTQEAPAATPKVASKDEAALDKIAGSLGNIKDLTSNPPGILVLASIGTFNSLILKQSAEDQETASNDNAAKVETIMKTYQDSWANNCPNGREKLEEPNCYCYLEDGTKNTGRTNSQTCVQLWASRDFRLAVTETNYDNPTGIVNPIGCVAVNGQFDQNCQCKKMIDSSGKNACMQSSITTVSGANPTGTSYLTNSGIGNVVSAVNSMTNGSGNLTGINGGVLQGAIATQNQLNSQLFKAAQNDPSKKDFPLFKSNADLLKAQQSLFSPSNIGKISASIGASPINMASNSLPNKSMAKVLAATKKKSGLEMTGGKGLNKKGSKSEFNLNFGDSGVSSGNGALAQNFMDKNYEYKQHDIVNSPESSIFDIISNRYIESGLSRLFQDK